MTGVTRFFSNCIISLFWISKKTRIFIATFMCSYVSCYYYFKTIWLLLGQSWHTETTETARNPLTHLFNWWGGTEFLKWLKKTLKALIDLPKASSLCHFSTSTKFVLYLLLLVFIFESLKLLNKCLMRLLKLSQTV